MPHKVGAPQATLEARPWPATMKELCGSEPAAISESSCICRFAKTTSLPIRLTFLDAFYNLHAVEMTKATDTVSIVLPARSALEWSGDEKDKTSVPSTAEFVHAVFTYEAASTLNSHGISVKVKAYGMSTPSGRKSINWSRFLLNATAPPPLQSFIAGSFVGKSKEDLQRALQEAIDQKESLQRNVQDKTTKLAAAEQEKAAHEKEFSEIDAKIKHEEAEKARVQQQLKDARRAASPSTRPQGMSVETNGAHSGYVALDDQDGQQQTCCKRSCTIS